MKPEEILSRLARTLKQEIAPAVSGDYARTQAYMASVVLEKLSRQLALAQAHEVANRDDMADLAADLPGLLDGAAPPPAIADALQGLAGRPLKEALDALIRALYLERDALGEARFTGCLARVRQTLRQSLTRDMEFAA